MTERVQLGEGRCGFHGVRADRLYGVSLYPPRWGRVGELRFGLLPSRSGSGVKPLANSRFIPVLPGAGSKGRAAERRQAQDRLAGSKGAG